MINLTMRPFSVGKKHAVAIEAFGPNGENELFLQDACLYLGAIFVKWHQGIEMRIGEVIYQDSR
jgi:hypothetical protein